jgi:hypothetical protein
MIQERQRRYKKIENKEFKFEQFGIKLTSKTKGKSDGIIEISFELTEKWNNLYGLLRGFSELYRSPVAHLKNNHKEKSFTLCYKADAINEMEVFMGTIFFALKRELQFRKVLQKLISIKRQQHQETQLLFKDLT